MEWTRYVQTCVSCRRSFRVSQGALDSMCRAAKERGRYSGEAETARRFDWCLECAFGERHEGEIVGDEPRGKAS